MSVVVAQRRTLIAALALLLTVTGCLSLPSEGGVQEGVEEAPADDGLDLVAADPAPDASSEEIVRGFLFAAAAGLADDFDVARQFLTASAGEQWDPRAGVTIYADADSLNYRVNPDDPTLVTVAAQVSATVDERGTYAEAPAGTVREFAFSLQQDTEDQWRISALDDGALVSWVTFGSQYRQMSVYFLSTDGPQRLVPEARWVPRSGSENAAVRGLLAGPADWLAPGVVSAVPDGTMLTLDAVAIVDGVATVNLSRQLLDASAADRALVQAQLSQTLAQLPQVRRVEMSVDGSVLAVDEQAALEQSPDPARFPTVVTPDGLAELNSDTLEQVDGVAVPPGLTHLALGYGSAPPVGLEGQRLVTLTEDATEPVVLWESTAPLLAPSVDVQGWVWTGPMDPEPNRGALLVVDPVSGQQVSVAAPGLIDLNVVAIRVSREGARVAYAVRSELDVRVFVAAVERDASGLPVALGAGVQLGAQMTDVRDLVWVDDVELGVLGAVNGALTVYLIGVGGTTVPLPSVDDTVAVAGGDGPRQLYLATSTGELYGRSGNGWRVVVSDVRLPTFAG
ncbi:MAG: LpqB family beta-propeller domain-containing protein [Beutenbergiaceae bacterium]